MNKHDLHRKKREARKRRRETPFIQSRAREKLPRLTIERDEGVSTSCRGRFQSQTALLQQAPPLVLRHLVFADREHRFRTKVDLRI